MLKYENGTVSIFRNPSNFVNGNTLYNEGNLHGSPKMMSVGLHCRIIGRPGRMQSLIKFFDYVQGFDDIWICQRKDIAHHWHNNYQ